MIVMNRLFLLLFFLLCGCEGNQRAINNSKSLYTVMIKLDPYHDSESYCHNPRQRIELLNRATIFNISPNRNQWWIAEDGRYVNLSRAIEYSVHKE